MQNFVLWLEQILNIDQPTIYKIISTVSILVVGWIVYRIILATIVNRIKNIDLRYQWQKATDYLFFISGVFVIGRIWYEGMTAVATFLGLVSAGIAIALKDPIVNFVGWLFIVWRRPFSVGDRIQIGEYAGDIVDQRIFQFSMMEIGNWVDADQSTGRVLHLPNGWVFTQAVANFTHGPLYIWNETPVTITFESDWKTAKTILQKIVDRYHSEKNENVDIEFRSASRNYLLKYDKLTPIVYTAVADHGVQLTARYLCRPRARRESAEYFWEAILNAFAENSDIDLAYPTQRFITNKTIPPGQDP